MTTKILVIANLLFAILNLFVGIANMFTGNYIMATINFSAFVFCGTMVYIGYKEML